jgi:hypothetical protein
MAPAIRPGGGSELLATAMSKEERMRKLVATIAAALALSGVGLATHTATSDAPADARFTDTSDQASSFYHLLPFVEQDNLYP